MTSSCSSPPLASGKGGVGKSTFVSNLAVELDNRGFTVGIIDADMLGPSQPTLLGSKEKPQINPETKKIMPIWEEYYRNLNTEVPEGEIGINPGIMSISKKIDIVHHYGKPSIK